MGGRSEAMMWGAEAKEGRGPHIIPSLPHCGETSEGIVWWERTSLGEVRELSGGRELLSARHPLLERVWWLYGDRERVRERERYIYIYIYIYIYR